MYCPSPKCLSAGKHLWHTQFAATLAYRLPDMVSLKHFPLWKDETLEEKQIRAETQMLQKGLASHCGLLGFPLFFQLSLTPSPG